MAVRSIALLCAALALGCSEEPAPREARPVSPPVVDTTEPPPPPPPPGRAVWIDERGGLRESLASSDRVEVWSGPATEGLRHVHAVLPGDRVVAGVRPATEARLGYGEDDVRILDRAGGIIEVGVARRVWVTPDGRSLVLERQNPEHRLGTSAPRIVLDAFDLEGGRAVRIGSGSFLGFDENGRAISLFTSSSIGPNDMPTNHRSSLMVAPMPGDTSRATPPELVPVVGPRGTVARIDPPQILSMRECTLRIEAAEIAVRGHVCDRIDPIVWAPDESAVALLSDERDLATLRVLAPDGRELGTYDAGSLGPSARTRALGTIAFAPDASELALERPDGAVVRLARDGRVLAELGPGALRGYDHSGRYVLIVGERGARLADTRDGSVRELGPAADAAWLPPAP